MGLGKILIGIGLGVAGIKIAESEKARKLASEFSKKPRETLVKGLRALADEIDKIGVPEETSAGGDKS